MSPAPHRLKQRLLASLAVAAVACTTALPAVAATTDPNPNALELANAQLSLRAATQGMVLLENHDQTLPMASSGNIAVFGVGSYRTVPGGTGSGSVNSRYTVNVLTGLADAGYTITTDPAYSNAMHAAADALGGGSLFSPIQYHLAEQALTPATVQPTNPTDTALFVIARNSGEFVDRSSGLGDYQLNAIERANIELLGQTYRNVVVVLNSGGIMDTAWFDTINASASDPDDGQAVDALLLMSQAGQESGHALVDTLDGTVSPSGKLTDTWASAYSYYPASATFANNDGNSLVENYNEGVYNGYRYFDSMYKSLADDPATVVNYPFGHGLSYTSFDVADVKVTANHKSLTVRASVTNTGTTAGREVVQVYVSAPQTGLDKPYQELQGFAKTDQLAPGQSQGVTITFKTSELASYDTERAAWTLEGGDYLVRVGTSSRDTHVAAKVFVTDTVVTEQLSTQLDAPALDELESDPADFYTYATEQAEIAAAKTVRLPATSIETVDNASEFAQDVEIPTTSPLFAADGSLISSITASVDPDESDWAGTGAPYVAKEGETVAHLETDPTSTLYDVAKGEITMEEFVAGLSTEQLANIVEGAGTAGSSLMLATGSGGYTTSRYESLGIPGLGLQDGPAGLRLTRQSNTNPVQYQWATAWPIGTMLAQTFDPELVTEVGVAIGEEMEEYGTTLWLAPSLNIHRDPLNGRNFEYYSEDPLVAGITTSATTIGVQSVPGRGVAIKHYAANQQETTRTTSNSRISERALREIYLKGFEVAVKESAPMSIMTSYNLVNGTYAAGNYDLIQDVARGEWGFEGLVMTDWGAGPRAGATNVMYAGNDLIMPGNNPTEVLNALRMLPLAVDASGLPVYTRRVSATGSSTYTWQFNSWTPSANGTASISTRIDSSTDLAAVQSRVVNVDAINNETVTPHPPYASVHEAYQEVATFLATTGNGAPLSNAQRAATTISDVVREIPGDATSPVVAYTVTIRGSYPATVGTMRLGDVQRSARNILTVVMQSAPFELLAAQQGVDGIDVAPYADQFVLADYIETKLGPIQGR